MQTGITNNHFKMVINEVQEYLDKGEDVPQELFIDFIGELKYTNLLLPAIIDGDDLIFENLVSDEDDSTVIPLYTDDVEFESHNDPDYEALANDIEYYVELVNDQEFDGVLINQGNQDFFIGRDLLNNMPFGPDIEIEDNFEGYSPDKLYDIAKNASNDSLVEFMKTADNGFEALMLELSKSTLLNVVASDEDLDKYAENGIIPIGEVDDFEICTTNDGIDEYGILFTSVDAINRTKGEGNFYCQLTLLDDFIDFVLRSDMAGIIINPGIDDYLISREYLIEAFGGLGYNNPNFKRAFDYLFTL